MRETNRRLNLMPRLAQCFLDGLDPDRVEHSMESMLVQRIYGWRWATKISTITTNSGTTR